MIVCHCLRLSDRALRCSIREGACSREELMEETGAGTCCGGCRPALDELLDEERLTSAPKHGHLPVLATGVPAT